MRQLRSHTMRFTAVLLLCAGFSFYIAQPGYAEQSPHAFASWLGSMTKTSEASNLQQELFDLKKARGDLGKIIEKASRIVSRNNEEFNFPFEESEASQQLYQLLLIEWNQFQTGNAMNSVPAQPSVKLLPASTIEKGLGFGSPVPALELPGRSFLEGGKPLIHRMIFQLSVTPMSDGVAIGAP